MDLNHFTTTAQQAGFEAQHLAETFHHSELDAAHMLLALLNQVDDLLRKC